jgi:TorA maturation chaperone TorD
MNDITKSQKRALADLSCATRSLAALFRHHGHDGPARRLEDSLERAKHLFTWCWKQDKLLSNVEEDE